MNRYEVEHWEGHFEINEIDDEKELGFMNEEVFAEDIQTAIFIALSERLI